MSQSPQSKWDRRFSSSTTPNEVAQVLQRNRHLLPQRGRALELACGLGGNALFLAAQGLQVDAVDVSPVALQKLANFAAKQKLDVTGLERDIESDWQSPAQYDVIVCSHYLYRPLCPRIAAALNSGGLLFYQTFTLDKLDSSGPKTADYLLRNNELLQLFSELDLVYYREDGHSGDLSRGSRNIACFVGRQALDK